MVQRGMNGSSSKPTHSLSALLCQYIFLNQLLVKKNKNENQNPNKLAFRWKHQGSMQLPWEAEQKFWLWLTYEKQLDCNIAT